MATAPRTHSPCIQTLLHAGARQHPQVCTLETSWDQRKGRPLGFLALGLTLLPGWLLKEHQALCVAPDRGPPAGLSAPLTPSLEAQASATQPASPAWALRHCFSPRAESVLIRTMSLKRTFSSGLSNDTGEIPGNTSCISHCRISPGSRRTSRQKEGPRGQSPLAGR